MITLAALTGPLPKAGVVVAAVLAAAALLLRDDRQRGLAMLGALVVSPPLLVALIWHDSKLHFVHHHPTLAAAAGVAALAVVVVLALAIDRWPELLAVLALLALPFRVSVAGSNLLVPLYFVIGAGALRYMVRAFRSDSAGRTDAGWLERLLALVIVLYGIQALYSTQFGAGLKNMVFFYVPFALLYCLLVRIDWTPRLLRICAWTIAVLAVALAGVAFVEYAARTTWFSARLAADNQLYSYFVANSVFFDPNIFGRFLALVMVALAVLLLYERPGREQLGASVVLAVLWGALVISFSRSSMIALLVGLALLAAIRWRPEATLALGAVVVILGGAAIAIRPTTFGLNQGLNGVSAGRGSVLKGGVQLFGDRPLQGFGSGSFEHEYRIHNPNPGPLTASHTTPVTVAAEQGLIGELAYLALVGVALVVLVRGARAHPARAAVAAAFAALVAHTMLYADFLEDPFTWALLGIGAALARASLVGEVVSSYGTKTARPMPSVADSASGAVACASSTSSSTLSWKGGRWISSRRSMSASTAT